MTRKLSPNEAPPGYVAAAASGCKGCAFDPLDDFNRCTVSGCTPRQREDGHSVIFIKREPAPAKPAPLDARYSQRMPAATKAKAMRIGGAAVIAAIEAVQE